MREDRDALMDKLHQQTTETTSFKMENERLKVSDFQGFEAEMLHKEGEIIISCLASEDRAELDPLLPFSFKSVSPQPEYDT